MGTLGPIVFVITSIRKEAKTTSHQCALHKYKHNKSISVIIRRLVYFKKKILSLVLKECMPDSVTNYNYAGDTKISVSIKKTNANKCTLSELFLTEILKSLSAF